MSGVLSDRTYRVVDGERIEGTWRHVFIRNGDTYFLTDLLVYADGAIWCWEWVDLDGLHAKIDSGWVATSIADGARASAHEVASWRFTDPMTWVSGEELLGEVADAIESLNGRPDSTDRCLQAARQYVRSRAEPDRLALRAAYEAIPAHQRIYALGDMDYKDTPLRILCAELGERLDGYTAYDVEYADDAVHDEDDRLVVTERERQWAFDYFAELDRGTSTARERRQADGPEGADAPSIHLNYGRPMYPGTHGLRNEYPAPITVEQITYPTVEHAY